MNQVYQTEICNYGLIYVMPVIQTDRATDELHYRGERDRDRQKDNIGSRDGSKEMLLLCLIQCGNLQAELTISGIMKILIENYLGDCFVNS